MLYNSALDTALGSVVLSHADGLVEGEKHGRRVRVVESPWPTVCWAWPTLVVLAFYHNERVYTFCGHPEGGNLIGGALDAETLRRYGFTLTPEDIRAPAEYVF